MSDQLPRNPDEPGIERVERIEYIERVPGGQEPTPPPRQSSPMWIWVLPLVLIAIALIWYVLSRGEPASPVEIITLVETFEAAVGIAS